jgi:predicted nuclease of predicted toxin-antitoxin system
MDGDVLRFLADESCATAVIRVLREDRHDVFALSEVTSRTVDVNVLAQAAAEGRIVLTEDSDFGTLVFVEKMASAGVIYMRFPQRTRRHMAEAVRRVVRERGTALIGAFTVIQPGVVRITRPPPPDS